MPGNLKHRKVIITSAIIFGIFIVDQVTKLIAVSYLRPYRSIPLVGDFLRLTYVENTGMAFGIDINNRFLFNMISLLAVGIIFYYLYRLRNHAIMRYSFAIILGGAFGNLWDRFFRGRVVDFFDIEFFDIHFSGGTYLFWELPSYSLERWPVFNVADMAVTIGMLIIVFTAFVDTSPESMLRDAPKKEIYD